MTRRPLVLAGAAAVVLLALVPVGRWERDRHVDRQLGGIRDVVAAIGPLDSPSLSGYRRLRGFDCLTYRRGAKPFALELCFLDDGSIVEAIDRRGDEPVVWSLRDDSKRASVQVERSTIDRLLRRMDAPPAP